MTVFLVCLCIYLYLMGGAAIYHMMALSDAPWIPRLTIFIFWPFFVNLMLITKGF